MPLVPRELKKRKVKAPDEFTAAEEEAKVDKPSEVLDGPELFRILTLAKRDIPDPDAPESIRIARFLTERMSKVRPDEYLKNPPPNFHEPGPFPGALMATQGLALREGKVNGGGFFPIVVGGGKMLTCFLLAALHLAAGTERVVYCCPGANVPDCEKNFAFYRDSWHGPSERQMRTISYELISHPSNAEELDGKGKVLKLGLLDRLRPQVLIFDESHNLADTGSAVTKRVKHYLAKNPNTIVYCFSGTPYPNGTIKDVAHLLEWCLKERSPLPRMGGMNFLELQGWSGYLDAKSGAFGRVDIGALRHLAEQYDYFPDIWTDGDELKEEILHEMRRVVARRILETPGVIGTQDLPLDIPLTLEPWYPINEDPDVTAAYEDLLETNTLPDGTELADEMSTARHLSSDGYCFWSKWVPAPPAEWKLARNTWSKWCRRALRHNKKRLTSEATMKGAVRKGLFKGGIPILNDWERESASYLEVTGLKEPPSVPQWVNGGREVVESVRAWVHEHQGLVWVQHIGLGELLARELNVPYYGSGGGKDVKTGRNILDHRGGAAIASVAACGTGKNLQTLWSKNLWLTVPGEQAMARTHRRGQKAAVVRNWYYLGAGIHLESIERAIETKAAFAEDMMLSPQKLRYAQNTLPDYRQLSRRGGFRWEPTK
jgi:hypothetical protein